MTASDRLAQQLLEIGAVTLSPEKPFTWASGLRSPVYCDNRMSLGFPAVRRAVRDGFVVLLEDLPRPDRIAGTATAGIPHAAWLADRLDLPMVYVRGAAKGHGRGKRIEGPVEPGDAVVLVEDLVSTGMSSITAVEALQEVGAHVDVVVAIFTYGLPKAQQAFEASGVPLRTLLRFEELIVVARRIGQIDAEAARSLSAWYQDPEAWSARISAHEG